MWGGGGAPLSADHRNPTACHIPNNKLWQSRSLTLVVKLSLSSVGFTHVFRECISLPSTSAEYGIPISGTTKKLTWDNFTARYASLYAFLARLLDGASCPSSAPPAWRFRANARLYDAFCRRARSSPCVFSSSEQVPSAPRRSPDW